MKIFNLSFMLWFFIISSTAGAEIIERIIYAGDTPLLSNCVVTQTAPMELTVVPCSFTTTGQARVLDLGLVGAGLAQLGVSSVAELITQGRAEFLPGTPPTKVRGWLTDRNGKIIKKAKRYISIIPSVMFIPAGDTYFIYLVEKAGPVLETVLLPITAPRPAGYVHYLAFEFEVPLGTTDLSGIKIEVFTVRPGFPPAKGIFEK